MFRIMTILALLFALTVVAPASAQESVRDGYGGAADVLGEVGEVESGAPASGGKPVSANPASANRATAPDAPSATSAAPVAQASDAGQLPFTGLDVALIAFGGLALLAMGLGFRRLSREHAA